MFLSSIHKKQKIAKLVKQLEECSITHIECLDICSELELVKELIKIGEKLNQEWLLEHGGY